jgi:hypothetical protein
MDGNLGEGHEGIREGDSQSIKKTSWHGKVRRGVLSDRHVIGEGDSKTGHTLEASCGS